MSFDRNLALEFVRVTEAAAIAAAGFVGKGDAHAADGAAVAEMRSRFNQMDFQGTVVIGEGAKDEAPMLYTGEQVGRGSGPEVELAVDPLECTDSVAYGRSAAMSVIVAGPPGSLLHAPDTYMEKLAVGPKAVGAVDFSLPPPQNMARIAQALGKPIEQLTVVVLDRPRHQNLIKELRATGVCVRLVTDGDVEPMVAACLPEGDIDAVIGSGGSTEAVLAAAALKILGGQIWCRFAPRNEADTKAITAALAARGGKYSLDTVFTADDLAAGQDLAFTATGVLGGAILKGVRYTTHHCVTHSVVMRARSGTIRFIETHHRLHT